MRERLLIAVLDELARWYRAWLDQPQPGDADGCRLREEYLRRSGTVGAAVTVMLPGGQNLTGMAAGLVKWAHEVHRTADLGPVLRRAFHDAASPPTGPVFVSIPMDVLQDEGEFAVPAASRIERRAVPAALADLASAILAAPRARFAVVAGDEVARSGATGALAALAERLGCRVYGTAMHSTLVFPTAHPLWAGALPADAEQVRAHPVGHREQAGQPRPVRVLDGEQPGPAQRGMRGQPGARPGVGLGASAQSQCQPDAGPSPGHVVVEVPVERLEPAVQLTGEGHQEQFGVQCGQPGGAGQPAQPYRRTGAFGRVGGGLDRGCASGCVGRHLGCPAERRARGGQQRVDRLVGQVQPAERVVGRGIGTAPLGDGVAYPLLDGGQPAQQVGEVSRVAHGHSTGASSPAHRR